MRQYHIQVSDGEVGRYVLMPGDPARSEIIAKYFDKPALVAKNREFTTYTGEIDGELVSVCSTGIGSPSSAIAMEELIKVGADTFIRVGTCGALQKGIHFGDLVLVNAAVRDEGTSLRYLPVEFPAVADFEVIADFREGLRREGIATIVGTSVSVDAFYGESETVSMPLSAELTARIEAWRRGGAVCAEMECSALYIVAAVRGVRAGGVMVVVDEVQGGMPPADKIPVEILANGAIKGLKYLIGRDRDRTTEKKQIKL